MFPPLQRRLVAKTFLSKGLRQEELCPVCMVTLMRIYKESSFR